MPLYSGSIGNGLIQGTQAAQQFQLMQLQIAQQRAQQDAQRRAMEARQVQGGVLDQMFPAGGLPPPPGTPQGGPQPPVPGASSQPPAGPGMPPQGAQGGMPPPPMVDARRAPQGPPPIQTPVPPFKPLPTAPGAAAPAPAQAAGGVPPPPQPQPEPQVTPQQAQEFLPRFIDAMRKQGVPPDQWADVLDNLPASVKEATSQQIKMLHEQNQMLINWANAGSRAKTADAAVERAETGVKAEERRKDQGQQNLDIRRQKAAASVAPGATEKLTPEGMKVAQELIRAGKNLPGGWSKAGMSRGNAILNEMGKDEEGGAGSGSVAAGQAQFKADSGSLNAIQKRVDGIELGTKKIGKDIQTVNSYIQSGNAGSVKFVNRPLNWVRTQTSDTQLAAYALAVKQVATEYERLIQGGMLSTAQLHEGAREDASKILNESMSIGEVNSILPVMLREIDNQKQAANEQLKEIKDRMKAGGGESGPPRAGTVEGGYKFKGGDPAKKENWEKV